MVVLVYDKDQACPAHRNNPLFPVWSKTCSAVAVYASWLDLTLQLLLYRAWLTLVYPGLNTSRVDYLS